MMTTEPDVPVTTYYVRLAKTGNEDARNWIAKRFSPVLLARALREIPPDQRGRILPEDVVSETWLVALPRLPQLDERDGRSTPVLVSYLVSVLDKKLLEARRHSRNPRLLQDDDIELTTIVEPTEQILRTIVKREASGQALDELSRLAPQDAQIVQRILQGEKVVDIAMELGEKPNSLSKRTQRIFTELRRNLAPSVFDDYEVFE